MELRIGGVLFQPYELLYFYRIEGDAFLRRLEAAQRRETHSEQQRAEARAKNRADQEYARATRILSSE